MFVRLDHVSFSYSDAVALLCDVTLQLAPGWTGVVGANGAGKTTLLRLVIGALDASSRHHCRVETRRSSRMDDLSSQ